jgi:alpha-ketoglutarate-dependent taurine dioxygenase
MGMEAGPMDAGRTHRQPNPFDLDDDAAYRAWRERRLERAPRTLDDLCVEVRDLEHPTTAEHGALLDRVRRTNMVLYHCSLTENRGAVLRFAEHFGLMRLDRNPGADDDGLSAIRVLAQRRPGEFIPYTDRAIRWHTDGYYNPPERRVRAFLLHCVRPATQGGTNRLLDPELLYIRLRDADPAHIAALMHPEAMTVPAHVEKGIELRPAQAGPVFAVLDDGFGPRLHLRYTARTRSIAWRNDTRTRAAVTRLEALLDTPLDGTFEHRLAPGEGILCNNVLHSRGAFSDTSGSERLLYRARFHERIANT